jgi:hypothetical protein
MALRLSFGISGLFRFLRFGWGIRGSLFAAFVVIAEREPREPGAGPFGLAER